MTPHLLWVIVHSLAVVVFVNRYIAGLILRLARRKQWDETIDDFEPTVTAVIPMFNEGASIKETLQSILDSDYPTSKLRVICVDDCSTDDSVDHANEIARASNGRLTVVRNRTNLGKRRSINRAVRQTDSEIIVSVDSDVVVDTAGNTVTLTGHVRNWAEHDAVMDAAWMAPGVYDVHDDLDITG